MKKIMVLVLSLMMIATTCGFNVLAEEEAGYEKTVYRNNGFEFEKLSHAESGTEEPDGVVDYIDGKVTPHVNGDENRGDLVQSYSYCSAAAGDWIYVNTMYGALGAYSTATDGFTALFEGLGVDITSEFSKKIVDALYNGRLNKGYEEDGSYEGSVLFKFNVKTGETVILMSRDMYEADMLENGAETTKGVPIFRSAVELDGVIYFVGLVSTYTDELETYYQMANGEIGQASMILDYQIMLQNGVPKLYALKPSGDNQPEELIEVKSFADANHLGEITAVDMTDPDFMQKVFYGAFTSTRAIGTYQGHLVVAGIELAEEGATWIFDPANPEHSPAAASLYMSTGDSLNKDAYVKIASQKDLFDYPAIWRDGASGGGGIYQVLEYNGKLYVAIVTGRVRDKNGLFQAYAVVKGEPVYEDGELKGFEWTPVIGDKADGAKYTFGIDPERGAANAVTMQIYGDYLYLGDYNDVNGSLNMLLSGNMKELANNLKQSINLYRMDKDENIECVVGDPTRMFPESISGLGSGYESSHMMQYTWMTTVFNDVMYLSSMDETSLTHALAQLVNGELLSMSAEEWESQIAYLKALIEEFVKSDEEGVEPASVEELNGLVSAFEKVKELINSTDHKGIIAAISELKTVYNALSGIPEELDEVLDQLLALAGNEDLLEQLGYLQEITDWMECSVAGFDLYAIKHVDGGKGVNVQTVTLDGFNDRYNHGLRIFQAVNGELVIGTANPFYGTQLWKMTDTPYVACVEDAKEAISATVEASNDLAMNAIINGMDQIASDAGMASANEIAAGLHLNVAESITNKSDEYTKNKALDATEAKEKAEAAANEAAESLETVRETLDAGVASDGAKDALMAKLEAQRQAKEAEEAYEKAQKEYEWAKAHAEEALKAGLADAQEAEAAAEAAKAKADKYYNDQLKAKKESEKAVLAATQALLEAADKLNESIIALDETGKALLDEVGEAAPVYSALVAAKTVTALAQLTVKAYETEITTLDAMIEKLSVALADARTKYDVAKAEYDAQAAKTETVEKALAEAEAALEVAFRIKKNAELVKASADSNWYQKALELQGKLEDGNTSVVKELTETILKSEAVELYTKVDPEYGFSSAVTWVEADEEHYLKDGQQVFYVENSEGEKTYYEAVVEDGVLKFYKAKEYVGYPVDKLPALGNNPRVGDTKYGVVVDGEFVVIKVVKKSDCSGTRYEYALADDKAVPADAIILDTSKVSYVKGDEPAHTDSKTMQSIINKVENIDQEIAEGIATVNAKRVELEKETKRLRELEREAERIGVQVEALTKTVTALEQRREGADYNLNGDRVDELLQKLVKGEIDGFEAVELIWAIMNDYLTNPDVAEDMKALYKLIGKVSTGNFEVSDISLIIDLLSSDNISISAKLKLAIAEAVERIVEKKYSAEAVELKVKAEAFGAALAEVKSCANSYAKAVYNLSVAAVTDARNAVLVAEAKSLKLKADEARRAAEWARIEYEALVLQYGPTDEFVNKAKEEMEKAEAEAKEAEKRYTIAQRIADVCFSSDLHLGAVSTDKIFFDGKKDGLRYDLIVKVFKDQEAEALRLKNEYKASVDLDNSVLIDAYIVEDGERIEDELELDKPVKVVIDVPQKLLNKKFKNGNNVRTYNITCYHDGEVVSVVKGVCAKNGRISFEADRFSTYQITAVDSCVKVAVDTAAK